MTKIQLDINEFRMAGGRDSLAAYFGPCFVLGAVNRETAYMAHFASLQDNKKLPCVNDFFENLKLRTEGQDRVRVYASGGQIREGESREIVPLILKQRDELYEMIKEKGFIPEKRWCPTSAKGQEMKLVPYTGKILIQEF